MKTSYRHIHFEPRLIDSRPKKDRRKGVWACVNNRDGITLGFCQYYPQQRQGMFAAKPNTAFSTKCLADIQHFMSQLEKPSD